MIRQIISLFKSGHQVISLVACSFLWTGCMSGFEPDNVSEDYPPIFPDYTDVTVPSNTAPLNFMIEGAGKIKAVFTAGDESITVTGRKGLVDIPFDEWERLMAFSEGSKVLVEVSACTDEFPSGVSFKPFTFSVSADKINPWIVYRLIEPGYKGWRQMGIYQRELSSFHEEPVVTNSATSETCVNCHHVSSYSPAGMMFHARGANGGTILYKDGSLSKIKFNEIGPKKNTTYPAWHPEGRFIAFSSNSTAQVFFGQGQQPIEVYDNASDIVIYDTVTGEVKTDARFMTEQLLETFPAWSPDGRWLYFCVSENCVLPENMKDLRYHIVRVGFDPETGTLEEKTDTLYHAYDRGGSASWPRISPDGKYLLYTRTDYGTFPVWHREADLHMIDLQTMMDVDVSLWNDEKEADSYHSWSSDGRWVMFGSRRLDGRYTRIYIAHLDGSGKPGKPYLLPQEDPRQNEWRLKSFNVPEFLSGRLDLPEDAADLFQPVE